MHTLVLVASCAEETLNSFPERAVQNPVRVDHAVLHGGYSMSVCMSWAIKSMHEPVWKLLFVRLVPQMMAQSGTEATLFKRDITTYNCAMVPTAQQLQQWGTKALREYD